MTRFVFLMLLILSAATLATAQKRSPIVLEYAESLQVDEEAGVRRQELKGNVHITKDSLDVTCQNAVYYPDSGIIIFRDNVIFRDPHRTLVADQVIYNEKTEQVDASSRVRVYQGDTLSVTSRTARYFERLNEGYLYNEVRMREENRRVLLTGDYGYADHSRKYGRVTGDPELTERDSLQGLLTRVRGDTIEYFGEDKRIRVTNNVRVDRDSLIAFAQFLDYSTKDRMAVLVGEPKADRGINHIEGDTIRLFFEEGESLSRVEVIGNAVATNPADSGFVEPRNRMEGKQMTLQIDDGVLKEALIEGTAVATYYVREQGKKQGVNLTSGDRLRVFFDGRKMSRIRVEGGTQGLYTPEKLIKD